MSDNPIQTMKYIYGPVYSWRLGVSLGIDPLSRKEKVCNYDCIYCQLGPTQRLTHERKVFVPVDAIVRELQTFKDMPIDYLTFSGRGEPTLAANLGVMVRTLKKIQPQKIAVITNSSLLHRCDVQDDLAEADFVLAKLDAASPEVFEAVDRTQGAVKYSQMVDGIKAFRRIFRGRLALQMMFVAENMHHAAAMAQLARTIRADEIEINTPMRACASQSLGEAELECVKSHFMGLPAVSVYERVTQTIEPVNRRDTILRHGRYSSSS